MASIARPDHVTLPRLDVVRALCFLAVFGCHVFYSDKPAITSTPFWHTWITPVFGPGTLGVNMFFVLSGFLITFLLLREKALNGRIDVPRFWLRRILRIWPLYFVVVGIGFVVFQWLKARMGVAVHETADPWHYVFFYSNIDKAHGIEPDSSILTVLWSIAVEEQFYLVWPVLLLLVPRRWSPALFMAVVLASIGFRAVHVDRDMRLWHTFSCMGDLAVGAIGAWYASRPLAAERIRAWPLWAIAGTHALALALYFLPVLGRSEVGDVLFRCVFAAAIAGVILYQAFGRRTFLQLPAPAWLVYLGRISYGLYCLHQVAILVTLQVLGHWHANDHTWQVVLLQPLIALPLSIALASASYRFLEKPFLRLKDRFAYIVRDTADR